MRRNDGLKLTLDDGKTIIIEGKLNRFEAVQEGGKAKASYEKEEGWHGHGQHSRCK